MPEQISGIYWIRLKNLEEKLWSQIKKQGLASLCKGSYVSVAMAQIRKQDIYACLNRYRGFIG